MHLMKLTEQVKSEVIKVKGGSIEDSKILDSFDCLTFLVIM